MKLLRLAKISLLLVLLTVRFAVLSNEEEQETRERAAVFSYATIATLLGSQLLPLDDVNMKRLATLSAITAFYVLALSLGDWQCNQRALSYESEEEGKESLGRCSLRPLGELGSCERWAFSTQQILTHSGSLDKWNTTYEGLSRAWFNKEFRISLLKGLELVGREQGIGNSLSDRMHSVCFAKFDEMLCKTALFQPCSSYCIPLEACPDFFCETTLLSCMELLETSLSTYGTIVALQLSEAENTALKQYVAKILDRAKCNSSATETPLSSCYSWSGIIEMPIEEDDKICNKSSPVLATCAAIQQGLNVGFSLVLGLVVILFLRKEPNPKQQGAPQATTTRLKVLSAILLLVPTSLLVVIVVLSTFATGRAWNLPFLVAVGLFHILLYGVVVRVNLCISPELRQSWLTQLMLQFRLGGSLFFLRRIFFEVVELCTQSADLSWNMVHTLDYRWIVAFAGLVSFDLFAFPICLILRHQKLYVFVEVMGDLVFLTFKYWAEYSLVTPRTKTTSQMATILAPLWSISQLTFDVVDLYRTVHTGIHPSSKSSMVVPTYNIATVATRKQRTGSFRFLKISSLLLVCWSLGIALQVHVMTKVSRIDTFCMQEFSSCVWEDAYPKVYFDGGLFAPPTCAEFKVSYASFQNCNLTAVALQAVRFTFLEEMDLREMSLDDIPKWIPSFFESRHGKLKILMDDQLLVASLDWSDNGLTVLPLEILEHLPNLERLSLRSNQLTHLPIRDLHFVERLKSLDLSRNKLVDFNAASAFEFLDLSHNELQYLSQNLLRLAFVQGNESDFRFGFNPIRSMYFFDESESFSLSEHLVELPQLESLSIQGNSRERDCHVAIPEHILSKLATLTSLRIVKLCNGTFPDAVTALDQLKELDLSSNALYGTLPSSVGNLKNLQTLKMVNNELTGPIPLELTSLTNLREVVLVYNHLNGTLTSDIAKLSNLEILDLFTNNLSGTIPTEIGSLGELKFAGLSRNAWRGTVPTEMGLLSQLSTLGLSDLALNTSLPTELGELSKLTRLLVDDSVFSGTLPTEVGKLSSLRYLSMFNSSIHGTIPSELGQASELARVLLDKNYLTGTIPSQLGLLTKMTLLTLQENNLTGTIPTEILALPGLVLKTDENLMKT